MQKFNAYIDGFNLYNGALRSRSHLKWLDLISFCKALRPEMELHKVYYFTAPVKERFHLDDAPRRQHTYLRVLAHAGVQVIKGQFRKDTSWMRLTSSQHLQTIDPQLPGQFGLTQRAFDLSARLAAPDVPKANVYKMSEKGSDVNLASYLLRDAFTKATPGALVITGDSDLVTPIRFAVDAGVNVKVVVPNKAQKSAELKAAATHYQELHLSMLAEHQYPRTFITPAGGNISRPETWG